MEITILIHAGPESGAVASAAGITRSARAKGHGVTIFIMSAGVINLARESFAELISDGVNITVCEHNRTQYQAPEGIDGVEYGSQYDLAIAAQSCDRFISFT